MNSNRSYLENSNQNKKVSQKEMQSFLSELKQSEVENSGRSPYEESKPIPWKIILGIIISILAIIRLILSLV
jgi:hypothetical protein